MYSAIESFVEFCDEMFIAEEGLLDKFKKEISVTKAKNVSDVSQLKSRMYGEEPLIKLTGSEADSLVRIFKKLKRGGWSGAISSGVNSANGYVTAATMQSQATKQSGEDDATAYKLITFKGDNYLIRRGYILKERAKK